MSLTASVAMVNFNYGRYIRGAIDSVLRQTRKADEIIIVDDGSTDESRQELARISQAKIVLTKNRGQTPATETAFGQVTSDIVLLLDSDDLMQPNRIELVLDAYAKNPDCNWTFNGVQHVARNTLELVSAPQKLHGFTTGRHDYRSEVQKGRLPIAMPATSCLSWRTPFLRSLLPLPPGSGSADNYLKFASMGLSPGYIIDTPLTLQGMHEANMYTGTIGQKRRAFRAENAVAMCPAFERLGTVFQALNDRLICDAIVLSYGSLPPKSRTLLRAHLQELSGKRLARIAARLPVSAAREVIYGLKGWTLHK
jgi:glycosyltransferase involved in cell wall biosynthesis